MLAAHLPLVLIVRHAGLREDEKVVLSPAARLDLNAHQFEVANRPLDRRACRAGDADEILYLLDPWVVALLDELPNRAALVVALRRRKHVARATLGSLVVLLLHGFAVERETMIRRYL